MLKSLQYDYIVVGCGFTGSVIARKIAEERNRKVLIVERRNHIAGNMYDYIDANGVLIQKYGPHTYHTDIPDTLKFVQKFSDTVLLLPRAMSEIKGRLTPCPFNFRTIDDFYDAQSAIFLKARIREVYGERPYATILEILDSPDEMIRNYGRFLFENDYKPYTAKQWGISPEKIDASVLKRVPIWLSYNDLVFNDIVQCVFDGGFTNLFKKILDHPNITVKLNTDVRSHIKFDVKSKTIIWKEKSDKVLPIIYTGALDELFGYSFGCLPYRSLRFETETIPVPSFQKTQTTIYPMHPTMTRITEWTKLPYQPGKDITVITREFPQDYVPGENEPYYPVLTDASKESYEQYRSLADEFNNLVYCGRLADFRYYNMDQAIMRALTVYECLPF